MKVFCVDCKKAFEIDLTIDQIERIREAKEHIQVIMPNGKYTPEERELFVTGLCQQCWNKVTLFEEEEDNDDDDDLL